MTAQEFIDALINHHEEWNGKVVSVYGRMYVLKFETYKDDEPVEWWDVMLDDSPQQKATKLINELAELQRDPVGYYVAQKREELERELRRVERPNENG